MMKMKNRAFGLLAVGGVATAIASGAAGAFVGYVVTITPVTTGGVLLDQVRIVARFNGPTDTVLNVFNFQYQDGATIDPFAAFYHKDNSSYNGGVLSKQYGTWSPTLTGSATLNRPFDSFLCIGGTATATNTTNADPSWNSGGTGAHAGGASGWNRADLVNNGTLGWFNSSPPNLQGRVGVGGNTATDVLVGQFVIDRGAFAGNWTMVIGSNNGVAGSPVQFSAGSFSIGTGGPACPVLFRDVDGDGFGAPGYPLQYIYSCVPVTGYAPNNVDCDDTNASIFPQTWYPDADGDGFGSSTSPGLTTCTAQGAGFVLNNSDCNDSNAQITPNTTWYRDADSDGIGYAPNGSLVQCAQPAGYVLSNGDNCPNVANANQSDGDGDGLGDVCEWATGDLNLDGIITASDLPLFFNAWGSAGPVGDLNFDGIVNGVDFAVLLGNWGTTP